MERVADNGGRPEVGEDRIRAFLVDRGKLQSDQATERDDRIYNAAMSCIELSMRPYERRLLSRALHDSDRLEALLGERQADSTAHADAPPVGLFSPAEFREFVTLVEREVPQPGSEGPVPALFRTGAQLVAASYCWEDDTQLPRFQRISLDLRASLRLLEDLLNWVDSGKRGDRIETLREAQSRMESLEAESRAQHQEILAGLRGLSEGLGELRGGMSGAATVGPALQEIRSEIKAVRDEVHQLSGAASDDSGLQSLARDLEARISGLGDVTTQLVQGQQEIVRMLLDEEESATRADDEDMESAVDQLRSLMLIGLVGIAVVAILVIVSITTG